MPRLSNEVKSDVLRVMARVYKDAPDSEIPEKYLAAVHELRAANTNESVRSLRSERTPQKQKVKGVGRGKPGVPRPPKYSRGLVVSMHNDGKTIADIARELGAHRGTISRILTEKGVTERRYGQLPQEKCKNGHDMSEWGRPVKGGGRYCRKCKTERDLERRKNK